jgi:hypothetical protein
LDGYFPFLLGLDTDPSRARRAIEAGLLAELKAEGLPFAENGVVTPWRGYVMIRLLALYGYRTEARQAAARLLDFLAEKPVLNTAYTKEGKPLGAGGDAATAAAVLTLALERYEQDVYLLPDTKAVAGRLLQFRTPDSSFYLKREGLPESKGLYTELSVGSPNGGAILDEGAMIIAADQDCRVAISSNDPLDISEIETEAKIFSNSLRPGFVLEKRKRYLIKIKKPAKP